MPEWYVDQQRSKVNFSTALPTLVPNVDIYRIVVGADDAQFVARDAQLSYLWARAGQTVRAEDKAAAIAAQSTDPVPAVLVEAPTIGQGNVSAPDATATSKGVIQLAGDIGGTAASPTVAGVLRAQNNLADLTSTATARTSLGLGTAATQPATAFTAAPATPVASSATSGTLTAGAEHTLTPASAATRTLPTGVTSTAITPTTVKNNGTANVTIARGGSDTINGGTASIVVAPGEWARLASNGSGAWTAAGTYGQTGTYAPIGLDRSTVSVADRNTAAMRYFRQRLALRESAGCDICITPGDSITEGQGATLLARRWTDRLRDQLRLRFPVSGVTGGYGYIATQNVQTSFTYGLVTLAGSPPSTAYGYGRRALQIQNGTQTITLNSIAATAIDVYWVKGGGGTFAYAVDGGSTTNVSTSGTPTTPMVTRVLTGGGGTNHTVVLSWVSGNSIIAGFNVFNGDEAAGIRVHNGGFNGAHLSDFLPADSGQNIWPRYLAPSLLNPALVIVPIGANEFKTGDSVSTYQTNLAATVAGIRAYAPSASICLAVEHELGGVTIVNPWSQYVAANYAVAAADGNVAVFDLYQRLGSHSTAETNGLILASDHQHPSDAGQLFYADAFADWLGRV